MFNRDLFLAKCIEHGVRTQDAARIMGINPATLSRKMKFNCSARRCILHRRKRMLFFSPEPNFLRLELTFMQYSATGCAILQLTLDWRRAHEPQDVVGTADRSHRDSGV